MFKKNQKRNRHMSLLKSKYHLSHTIKTKNKKVKIIFGYYVIVKPNPRGKNIVLLKKHDKTSSYQQIQDYCHKRNAKIVEYVPKELALTHDDIQELTQYWKDKLQMVDIDSIPEFKK